MSETTTLYWTMSGTAVGDITLCERHALEATNIGAGDQTDEPFESMEEAVAVLNALAAMVNIEGLTITSSPTGECGECAATGECGECAATEQP